MAVARARIPLRGALDRGSLAPFVEGRDELPGLVRGDHLTDILVPPVEVAGQSRGQLVRLVESRADREGVTGLPVRGTGGAVLVPAVWLAGTGFVSGEHFEDHEEALARIRLLPPIGHPAIIVGVCVDEDHWLSVD